MPNKKQLEFKLENNGCLICTSHTYNLNKRTGMTYLRYWDSEKKEYTLLHRYIYEKFYGAIPENLIVRHKCDNPKCCNPLHLELGTRLENNRDRVVRNRSAKGERHGRAKLTEKDVIEIYKNNTLKVTQLARLYNVKHAHIYKIKRKLIWTDLLKDIA